MNTRSFLRQYSLPVDPAHGFKRVVIELSVPALPTDSDPISFAEHVLNAAGEPTDTVIACTRGGVVVSEDLGASWELIQFPELRGSDLRHSFTTGKGMHLLQLRGAATAGLASAGGVSDAQIAIFNQDWELEGGVSPGEANWHGSRSIDEAGGVIIYGEYPANRHRPGPHNNQVAPEHRDLVYDSHLLRSVDGGYTWHSVLRVDYRTIRHFHTVIADPWLLGRWWASSGDRPDECRVWESRDHGLTWDEVPCVWPIDDLHPSIEHNPGGVLRHTDMAVREHDLIWGADDFLGHPAHPTNETLPRRCVGARIFRSDKETPWRPECIGYVGNPVRSLVDIGPGYLVMTEAKTRWLGYRPGVLLLSKTEPLKLSPLLTIDNFSTGPASSFTLSRASRVAKEGVFFTYRVATDVFPEGACLMRWRVEFD
jgi:hypothetical protein